MAIDLFYRSFEVVAIDEIGNRTAIPAFDVEFYNITQDVTIDTLTTDSDGMVAAGGFDSGIDDVAAGDVVELRSAGSLTRQFTLSASADAAVTAPDQPIVYVAEDLATVREAVEQYEVYLKDTAAPDKRPVYLGDAKADGSLVKFPYQTGVAQNVELIFNPKTSTVKTEFADPSVRPSEALSIPALGGSGGVRALADFYADAPTVSNTDYEELYTYTIPAGTLEQNGDKISVEYGGSFAPNANTKSLRFAAFNTSVLTKSFTENGVDWEMECTIIRESNTVVRTYGNISVDGVTCKVNFSRVTGLDLDADDHDVILLARTLTSAGDVTAKVGYILLIPAAPVALDYYTNPGSDIYTNPGGDPYYAE